MKIFTKESCSCNSNSKPQGDHSTKKMSALNIISAVVFFLFPKCAFCWAAYASLFSYIGLEHLEYNSKWKYIILCVFLIGSIFLMWKHYKNKSWINILLYISGLTLLLTAYYLDYSQTWWIYIVAFLMLLSNFHLSKRTIFNEQV